jgi:hypothetical protein
VRSIAGATLVAIGVTGFVISLGLNTPFYLLLRWLCRIAACVRRARIDPRCAWPLPRSVHAAGHG